MNTLALFKHFQFSADFDLILSVNWLSRKSFCCARTVISKIMQSVIGFYPGRCFRIHISEFSFICNIVSSASCSWWSVAIFVGHSNHGLYKNDDPFNSFSQISPLDVVFVQISANFLCENCCRIWSLVILTDT